MRLTLFFIFLFFIGCDRTNSESSMTEDNLQIQIKDKENKMENHAKETVIDKKIFKGVDFNFKFDPKELLPKDPVNKATGDVEYITQIMIDSIKRKAFNFVPADVSSSDIVTIKTNYGNVKLKLFPEVAPKHCYNFKRLANSGYYDGTLFHRVIKDFMIQGGDILSRDSSPENDGRGSPGWNIDSEFSNLKHKRGILSMARGGAPNSGGSQFFICHKDALHLDGNYTIFGEVIENIHIIDLIANASTRYSAAKLSCVHVIPNQENPEDWVTLSDPKTRARLFSKIVKGYSRTEYQRFMMEELRSDQPIAPIKIKEVRVKSED